MPSILPDTLPPKLTLDALAYRTGASADTLRSYLHRGRSVARQTRRLVAEGER